MTRHLITGAGGFIGRHLAEYIKKIEPNSEVLSLGRECDLTNRDSCLDYFNSCGPLDYIFHLADVSGNARWAAANSGNQFFENSKISLNILEAFVRFQKNAKFVGFSSIWAYPQTSVIASEKSYWDGALHHETQHYGLNKKFLGVGLQACKNQFNVHGTMLVLGSVYGPGDHSDHVIPSLIRRMKESPDYLEVWGNGYQMRDFIYVDDQVHSIYLHRNFDGELLNISSGNTHSIREIIETLARQLPYNGKITYQSELGSPNDEKRIDISLASEVSGWPAQYKLKSLEDGLRLTLKGNN